MDFKCGHITIIGKPNVGKSTLINYIVGQKVSIVSWKPQTTRNRLLGIVNYENAQIVLIDTPGIHSTMNKLDKYMQKAVTSSLYGVDGILFVINAQKYLDRHDLEMLEKIKDVPKIILINKIDRVQPQKVAQLIDEISKEKIEFNAIIPISVIKGKNIDLVIEEILKILPYGPKEYDDDYYTTQNERFLAAEIIREKALKLLDKEIPYGIAVLINEYKIRPNNLLVVQAEIVVQKNSHKGIVLGKGGETIKKIGIYARQDLEEMTGHKVLLKLFVKVREDWRNKENQLKYYGYDSREL